MQHRLLSTLCMGVLFLFNITAVQSQIETVKHVIDEDFLGPHWIETIDFDDDGDLDIVGAASRDGLRWYENDGLGNFTIHLIARRFNEAWNIWVGDLDNDDDKDILALSNDSQHQLAWYENLGDNTFSKHVIEGDFVEMHGVFAADLTSNGHVDVLAAVYDNNSVVWWENDGDENFQRRGVDRNFASPHAVKAADLDGDGDNDVVAAGGGKTAWWRNDGAGNLSVNELSDVGGFSVVPVDLDQDGDLDIIRNRRDNFDIDWFENLGPGVFVEHTIIPELGESWSQAVADLDQDGDLDLVIGEHVPNQISYWLNDGNQNFSGFILDDTHERFRCVNVGDYNGDGKIDIAAVTMRDASVFWYEVTSDFTPVRSLTLTAPNGGETFDGGQNVQIAWESSGEVSNVAIEYSTNGGASWNQITAGTANDGSFDWILPNIATSNALVRITDVDDATVNDQSDGVFTINEVILEELNLTAPNGGETWNSGSLQNIMWTSSGNISQVKIEYSINNGSTWNLIVATAPNTGSYAWNIPGDIESNSARVRISDASDGTPSDQSNGAFTIVGGSLTLFSPNGGELLTGGDVHTITWSSAGAIPFVKLEYSLDGGISWTLIEAGIANTGSHEWTVPDIASTNARIRVSDDADGNPSDQSDGSFSIRLVSLSLFSPNGGEIWLGGISQTILWTSSGSIANVKLEYSLNDGATWETIVESTTNDGNHPWIVPDFSTSNARIRISDTTNPNRNDVSDGTFIINGSTLTLESPNGGETWLAGTTQQILWAATGLVSNIKITFQPSPTADSIVVAASASNSGMFSWLIPDVPTDSAKITIWDAADNIPVDSSDDYFSIVKPSLQVTSPNGGEVWSSGSIETVTWDSTGAVGPVNLEYTINNGDTWLPIKQNVPNTGSYEWVIPNWLSFDAMVRVTSMENPTVQDESDATFAILSASLTVTAPNGGEEWLAASTQNITWHSTGLINQVDIEYSVDAGATWQLIISGASNDGIFEWLVPAFLSEQAIVRVSQAGSGIPADMSDTPFAIVNVISSVKQTSDLVPEQFALLQNYPNPFNLDTRIEFSVAKAGRVSLRIFNVRGELVRTLQRGELAAGNYAVSWDGHDEDGQVAPSGIYIYNIKADGWQASRRLLLVK